MMFQLAFAGKGRIFNWFMNGKQTMTFAPVIAAVAPPLLLFGGLFALAAWLFSDTDKKKAEKAPDNAALLRKPLSNSFNSSGNSGQNPCVPASSIPATTENPVASPIKTITRENMAAIFNHGARKLDRKAAVIALRAFGFGKSAAYEALSPNGRFSSWLHCAPDGKITWKD